MGARPGRGRQRPRGARSEDGSTFALQFGTGTIGMMGTGNFNITLARDQMADHPFEFGISLLPGVEPGSAASFIGGDLVVIPNGSERVDDAVDFMKFLLSDETQVESYAKLLNLTTRSDMTDNEYFNAEPLVQDVAKALEVGSTPYTLTFFEQINDPSGPWLQMLQRAYYTDDDLDTIIADAKAAMKEISCRSRLTPFQHRSADRGAARAAPRLRSSVRRSSVYATRRYKLIGLLYVAPALLFVLVFTAYPFAHMVWVSLNSWSLITPPKFIGLDNFAEAFNDEQFWVSLTYSLQYTLFITPILMIGGYLVALLVSNNGPLRRVTRTFVFIPVVIGLGVSSLMWYWLFNPSFGLINTLPHGPSGSSRSPILWLGTDAWLSTWAIIGSITWKVLGFGMILFVAAIQAIPREINEATEVDGATFWQRTRRVTLPLTTRTILLVTLISVIGSLLAFDQFYIMTAGQPFNQTATAVYFIYLNSFPYLRLGYGATLSLILACDHPGLHRRAAAPEPAEPRLR